MTQGRATFSSTFARYQQVPDHIAEQVKRDAGSTDEAA
jgi:translation elongation factor EF-G